MDNRNPSRSQKFDKGKPQLGVNQLSMLLQEENFRYRRAIILFARDQQMSEEWAARCLFEGLRYLKADEARAFLRRSMPVPFARSVSRSEDFAGGWLRGAEASLGENHAAAALLQIRAVLSVRSSREQKQRANHLLARMNQPPLSPPVRDERAVDRDLRVLLQQLADSAAPMAVLEQAKAMGEGTVPAAEDAPEEPDQDGDGVDEVPARTVMQTSPGRRTGAAPGLAPEAPHKPAPSTSAIPSVGAELVVTFNRAKRDSKLIYADGGGFAVVPAGESRPSMGETWRVVVAMSKTESNYVLVRLLERCGEEEDCLAA